MANKKLKVSLVSLLSSEQLRAHAEGWHTFNDLEPYGLQCVGAVADEEGHQVRMFHPYQSANPTEEQITTEVIDYQPDILAISALTNAFSRASDIAGRVKQFSPKTLVVVGGDHITSYPRDLLEHSQIDLAVMGEGEHTFREVLRSYAETRDLEKLKCINGLAFVESEKLKLTSWRNRSLDRIQLSKPIRDKEVVQRSRVGALMYPSMAKQTGAGSVLFNFGCPLGCTYCTETTVGNGKVGRGNSERVVEEFRVLKYLGVNTGMMLDLTFNLYSEKSESLCRDIAGANIGINWYAMIRVTSPNGKPLVKSSLLEAMAIAGCSKVGFGIESFDVPAEMDYNRICDLDESWKVMKHLDGCGILSKALLMIGHPEETSEYYDKIKKYLKKSTPDEVRISFITPFPGTQLWNEKVETGQWNIATRDYNKYTTFNPVVHMNQFSPEEAVSARREILKDYYNSKEFRQHVVQKISKFPHLEESYYEFSQFLNRQKIV